MYCRWFATPEPAYAQLVSRLYGPEVGGKLFATYCEQLSSRALWQNRLEWQGVAIFEGDQILAHAIAQTIQDKPIVYMGYVEAVEHQEAAALLVRSAMDKLRLEQPGKTVYLPVNLSIWHSYRFKTCGEERLPFEAPCMGYYSRLFGDLLAERELYSSYRMALPMPKATNAVNSRFRIRQLSISNLLGDLRALYDLSGKIFESEHSNPTFEEFAALYLDRADGPGIDPRLILIAEEDGRAVGFIFAVAEGRNLYIKTFGVLPDFRRRGIARLLYDPLCIQARQMGCNTVYGLMIRDDRPVRRLLHAGAIKVAEYALYKDRTS